MNKFSTRLKELINEKSLEPKEVAERIGLNPSSSRIYTWLDTSLPSLKYLFALSKFFDCSLDYLCGRTEEIGKYKEIKPVEFSSRLQKIIDSKPNLTRYKLFKDLKLTKGHMFSWFNEHRTPSTSNYIKIADYLGVGLDELIGDI